MCVFVFVHFLMKKYNIAFEFCSVVAKDMSLVSISLLNPVKMFSYSSHLRFDFFKLQKQKNQIHLRLQI